MKQFWEQLETRIDTRSIRERGLLFAVFVIAIVALTNALVFKPLIAQEKRLERQADEDRKTTKTIQLEIEKMAALGQVDPEAENRAKLAKFKADADAAEVAVRNLQKGLVTPDQIGDVLEGILNRQGKLKLISLKKLPLQSLTVSLGTTGNAAAAAPSGANPAARVSANQTSASIGSAAAKSADSIYKHGVEIVVRGRYFDILEYMSALEKLPQQVFWGNARFRVETYPDATLTLELFTLSLEKKWLNI